MLGLAFGLIKNELHTYLLACFKYERKLYFTLWDQVPQFIDLSTQLPMKSLNAHLNPGDANYDLRVNIETNPCIWFK